MPRVRSPLPQPMPAPPTPSRRVVCLSAVAVALILLAIYHATVIPTVVDQDSGELVAAVHVLGIAHPTGYPLWVLLARGFDLLPLGGTSAYRVALCSAASATAAAGIVTALAAGLVSDLALAALAGLAFGLWFPTWSQAVRAEVYGLTALLVALSVLALLAWERKPSARSLGWLALASGSVAMHHRTAMLAIVPALIAAAALTGPRRVRIYLTGALLFVAPFTCYAYLPIRAAARPPVNWTDPSTLPRFLDHVLATQYQHFALSHDVAQMAEQAAKLLPDVLAVSPWLAALLAIAGIPFVAWGWWRWLRQQPAVAASLAVGCLLLTTWVLQWGETSDLKVFFLPLGEVLALCWALGLAHLARLFRHATAGRVACAAIGLALCGALLAANWSRSDLSNTWGHRDRWVAALSQMEPNAIFVSDFDVPSFATLYLQNVEGLRRDVTLLRSVRMPDRWYADLIPDRELRSAAQQEWSTASQTNLEIHDRTALFSYYLAKRMQGKRSVYCLHSPLSFRPNGPPYFVGLSEDLVALVFSRPEMAAAPPAASEALAEFPGGLRLLAFRPDRYDVGTGEMAGFRVTWEAAGALPPMQFGLELRPASVASDQFARKLLPKGRFVQGFPAVYGLGGGLPQEGARCDQRGQAIIPSNAPPGEYRVSVGIGPPYTEVYAGWTEVGRIRLRSRPLPANPP